jgi:hypothetical protein
VVAAVLSQPIGHRPESPDVMYDLSRDVWAKEFVTAQVGGRITPIGSVKAAGPDHRSRLRGYPILASWL